MSLVGRFTNAFADDLLALAFQGDTSKALTNLQLGLSSTIPLDDGTNITEPIAGEYARLAFSVNNTDLTSLGVGSRTLQIAIQMKFAQAITNWGEVQAFLIYADSGTRFIAYGVMQPKTIIAGMTVYFAPYAVTIKLP